LATRGGIAQWPSVNLSNPGASWSTPALTDGKPTPKPNWQCSNEPSQIVTDAAEVMVEVPKEVKRFRVGVRRGSEGFTLKVTDGGTRRIRKECAKAGEHSWYEFDYDTQEAVIYVPEKRVPLTEFLQ
jgi:hypothetical protein